MPLHPNRIIVPQRQVQGGFDFKFESDPYNVELFGLLTQNQYTDAINAINKRMRKARPGTIDNILLATGPLIVPLALWGIRHRNQVKRRKRQLNKAIAEFNAQYPTLYMRWNRRPQSMLTIERKPQEQQPQPQPSVMAEAQFVSDVIAPTVPASSGGQGNTVGHSMV